MKYDHNNETSFNDPIFNKNEFYSALTQVKLYSCTNLTRQWTCKLATYGESFMMNEIVFHG